MHCEIIDRTYNMKMSFYFISKCLTRTVFGYIVLIRFAEAVVPEYCLRPLNRSDCGGKSTPVFSYWKPGSRCEMNFWRGCPTWNLFQNEYECSLTCIFHSNINPIEDKLETNVTNECSAKFNDAKCNEITKRIFTYQNDKCVQKEWHGCMTRNMFDTEQKCKNRCDKRTILDILNKMDIPQLKDVLSLLDVIAEDKTTSAKSLQTTKKVVTKKPRTTKSISTTKKSSATPKSVPITTKSVTTTKSVEIIPEYVEQEEPTTLIDTTTVITVTANYITPEKVATSIQDEISTDYVSNEEIPDVVLGGRTRNNNKKYN